MNSEEFKLNYVYNPNDGLIYYAKWPGMQVATYVNSNGYCRLTVATNKKYYVHQLAYLFMLGTLPPKGFHIDHIDGDKLNNKWDNLRLATPSQNSFNSKIHIDNTSGVKGVSWQSSCNKWKASIKVNGNVFNLGTFATKDQAIAAVKKLRDLLHGEFANHG